MSLPVWLQEKHGHLLLNLHVQPGAKRTEIAGIYGEALKIRLAAPPVDGKANEALLVYLAELLEIARNRVELISGQTSRAKRVRIDDAETETLLSRLR